MPRKEWHRLVDKNAKKADFEYLIKHGEVLHYTLDGVSIHSVATKIQASFLTQLPERKETAQGYHKAKSDIKTVSFLLSQPLNSEDGSTTL